MKRISANKSRLFAFYRNRLNWSEIFDPFEQFTLLSFALIRVIRGRSFFFAVFRVFRGSILYSV
jgi:hypothetical protein